MCAVEHCFGSDASSYALGEDGSIDVKNLLEGMHTGEYDADDVMCCLFLRQTLLPVHRGITE